MKSLLAAALAVFAASVWGMSPQLHGTAPLGGQRGAELELTLRGERLADACELLFYSPGIQVVGLTIPTNQAQVVKARIKIAPDCRLGEHALRIRCASGFSDLRTFWVGPFPTVNDQGTNGEFAHPQVIPLNVTVEGVVQPVAWSRPGDHRPSAGSAA